MIKYSSILSFSAISKFSFNGIRAFLVLFLVNQLQVKQEIAFQMYAGVIALVYIAPILIGWTIDKGLNLAFLLLISVIAMLLGCLTLISKMAIVVPLSFFILADGIKRSALPLLLSQISQSGSLRNSRFIMQHAISNLGSMLGVIGASMLGEQLGWYYTFIAAALSELWILYSVMSFFSFKGVVKECVDIFRYRLKYLVMIISIVPISSLLLNFLSLLQIVTVSSLFASILLAFLWVRKQPEFKQQTVFIAFIMLFQILFMAMYGQGFSSLVIFCDKIIDKQFFSYSLPTTFFQVIDPMCTLGFGILLSLFSSKRNPYSERYTKHLYAKGFFIVAIGFLILAYGCWVRKDLVHPIYLITGIACFVVASLLVIPAGKAMVTELAPKGSQGRFFGIWMLSMAVGEIFSGKISKLTDFSSYGHTSIEVLSQYYTQFFLMLGGAAAIASILVHISYKVLRYMRQETQTLPSLDLEPY